LKNLEYVCGINVIINQKRIEMAYKISEDCTACGTCIDECPVEAISEGDIYKIDPDICTDCGACADVCPVEAIHPVQ
jgi:ferredoxin